MAIFRHSRFVIGSQAQALVGRVTKVSSFLSPLQAIVPENKPVWPGSCSKRGVALRITVHERESSIEITLEGRLAGPWVDELSKAWRETAPRLADRAISLDLRDLTYSNDEGKQVLREIFAQTNAEILTSNPLTKYLALEISSRESN
jgi:hypothetical protein